MKKKHYLLSFSLFVTCTLSFLLFFGPSKRESLKNIVSTTNEQFQSFKVNYLPDEQETKTFFTLDKTLLEYLGFEGDSNLTVLSSSSSSLPTSPVIVTYVTGGSHQSQILGLLNDFERILPKNRVIIYDLGLTENGLKLLTPFCNNTVIINRCQIQSVDLSKFPAWIADELMHTFRPIILQLALKQFGAIFYIDSQFRFLSNVTSQMMTDLFEMTLQKRRYDILTFPAVNMITLSTTQLSMPVTSLTHRRMFDYFHITDEVVENFQFLKMIEFNQLIVINSMKIHQLIMLPWLRCVLTQDCLIPIGAQSGGCKFDKKPSYRYSGCHAYDTSALNVVLGLRFQFNMAAYTLPDFRRFPGILFRKVNDDLSETNNNNNNLILRKNLNNSSSSTILIINPVEKFS